jgi:hypothetical protein
MKLLFTAFFALLIVSQATATTFEEGLQAYERKDVKSASKIWTRLANYGHNPARYALAAVHFFGLNNFPENKNIAAKYYNLLAKSGRLDNYLWNKPEQQVFVGNMYWDGEYILKNEKEAVRWYQKASSRNYAPAQYYLGRSYAKGRGLEQNFNRAFNLFSKSAMQGNKSAQEALGWLYFKGHGITKNIVYAAVWLNIAIANGQRNKLLSIDESQITLAQKKQIKRLTIACIFGISSNYQAPCKPRNTELASTLEFKKFSN